MYRIGELSKLLGVSEHTLRYYEKEGLVVPLRNGKNRIYSEEDRDGSSSSPYEKYRNGPC